MKKLYLVSIHSFRGSFSEATGRHHLVSMTDEEYATLQREFEDGEIASEMEVRTQLLSEPISFGNIYRKLFILREENGEEEDL